MGDFMGYSYKTSINFGLVYIPVNLAVAVRENNISFKMLDKKTMSRVQYKKTCVDCNNKEVEPKNIVKAYQYEEGKYVIFEESDFEKIKTNKDKNITIEHFATLSEIDPIFYDKSYYVVPSGGYKAFSLLKRAMEELNKVGIAKTILGNKEVLIMLRVKNNQMYLNTLHFFDEIALNPYQDNDTEVDKNELELAKAIINNMTSSFKPALYQNEYKERLLQAIETKIRGQELLPAREEQPNQVSSLLDALQESLKQTTKKKLKASDDVIDIESKEVKRTRKRTTTKKTKAKKNDA